MRPTTKNVALAPCRSRMSSTCDGVHGRAVVEVSAISRPPPPALPTASPIGTACSTRADSFQSASSGRRLRWLHRGELARLVGHVGRRRGRRGRVRRVGRAAEGHVDREPRSPPLRAPRPPRCPRGRGRADFRWPPFRATMPRARALWLQSDMIGTESSRSTRRWRTAMLAWSAGGAPCALRPWPVPLLPRVPGRPPATACRAAPAVADGTGLRSLRAADGAAGRAVPRMRRPAAPVHVGAGGRGARGPGPRAGAGVEGPRAARRRRRGGGAGHGGGRAARRPAPCWCPCRRWPHALRGAAVTAPAPWPSGWPTPGAVELAAAAAP